ncbi:MAG: hypothetical protein K6T90_18385 [Leptolyngbyaceae cyanobacterium HOT.MB2.61]|nr:hypothetical protein [Leptolyngbyaceae cyanobacterium HOT.MB2.61]
MVKIPKVLFDCCFNLLCYVARIGQSRAYELDIAESTISKCINPERSPAS